MENSIVFIGDAREVLLEIRENFENKIALVFTSPPYFVGRGYESYIKSVEEYWKLLHNVFWKCDFLMQDFGKVAVNFADRYANYKYLGRAAEICYVSNYMKMMESFDYDLWARIIWDKVHVMLDGARHIAGKQRFAGQMRVSPNYEYIFVWRVRGKDIPNKKVDMTKKEWTKWVDSIWSIPSVHNNPVVGDTKLAIFPEELPRRLIKMYTEPGDVILDPFLGSGTTVKVARNLGRVGIGIEKNEDMIPLLEENLRSTLFNEEVEICKMT